MNTVPAEILQEIANYLSGPDLDYLLYVNRTLYAACNIFKFRVLHVRVTREGLDNILKISKKLELAQCVRQITYPHNRLAPMQKPLLHEVDSYLAPTTFSEIELEDSGECVQTLEKALSRMPHIRAIIPGHNDINVNLEFQKWCRTLTETERAYVYQWPYEWPWGFILEPKIVKEGQEQVTKAIMDLVNTTHRLEFNLDRFGRGHNAGLWCRFFSKGSDLWNCASLFQNLTFIDVRNTSALNTLGDIGAIKKYAKEGLFFKFLSFLPNLRILSLWIDYGIFEGYEDEIIPAISLLNILGHGHTWKYLQQFHLNFPHINAEGLVEFLWRHARTLKFLRLWCTPLNDTWREILDCLKERLDLIDLDLDYAGKRVVDCFGGQREWDLSFDDQARMKDYVLRGGTPFPPTQMEFDKPGTDMQDFFERWRLWS
ncbi:hypothetical protein RUND412_009371 [Rhizina undulata]